MKLLKKVGKAHTMIAALAAAVCTSAQATVTIIDLDWQFYQGGYVQHDPANWIVFQNHYSGAQALNVVSYREQGILMVSRAAMEVTFDHRPRRLQFALKNTLVARASVDSDVPEGLAHAFTGLSMFYIRFAVENENYIYRGPQPLYDENKNAHFRGSVLSPGEYYYFVVDPFPNDMAETMFVGVGEQDRDRSVRDFIFNFLPQREVLAQSNR